MCSHYTLSPARSLGEWGAGLVSVLLVVVLLALTLDTGVIVLYALSSNRHTLTMWKKRLHMAPPRNNKFDAGSFGTLLYDFTKYGGSKGTIEDPSDSDIQKFLTNFQDLMDESGLTDMPSTEDMRADPTLMAEVMAKFREFDMVAQQHKVVSLVAEHLTGGVPSEDEILSLPFRVRVRFLAWVQAALVNPESLASGTTP